MISSGNVSGLWSGQPVRAGDLRHWAPGRLPSAGDEGLLMGTLQFSFVLGVRGGMAATAGNLGTMLRCLPSDAVWQVIAIGRATCRLPRWASPSVAMPRRSGGRPPPRKGELALGNRPLVEWALRLARELDRPVPDVDQAEGLLGP
ncbi:3-keto-5-aminohexanoate cleavage protein [Nonomuraea sp. M3C6]|uniref:3-keto-5-aminohexanoate cleavage protein n=1 Tax=Nonomuraea marmarensis TaxID=3351344 RepID=A0ABW7AQW4_9ACTN